MAVQSRQMQQHREARRALDERADRRTVQPQNEIALPVSRYCPVGRLGRTLADHDLRRDEALAALAHARPRRSQRPASSQARRQFTAQCPATLDEERLIDGFVADAHRLVIRKVDDQALGDLLRAPCFGPSSILSLAMSASVPGTPQDLERQCRSGPRSFQRAFPRHRCAKPDSAQASQLSDAGLIVRRATGPLSLGTRDRRCALRRCAVAHGRS